jgi:hypothetical protein
MHTSYLHKIVKFEVGIARRMYYKAIDGGRI